MPQQLEALFIDKIDVLFLIYYACNVRCYKSFTKLYSKFLSLFHVSNLKRTRYNSNHENEQPLIHVFIDTVMYWYL